MNKYCIAIFAHDGIISHHCGVGTVIKSHLELFPKVFHKAFPEDSLSLNAVTPFVSKKNENFNNDFYLLSEKTCHKNNGKLFTVSNGSKGQERWGTPDNWIISSHDAALISVKLIRKYDYCFFFFHDDPFAFTPLILEKLKNTFNNYVSFWIPHSSAMLNDYPFPDVDRLNWERKAISSFSNINNLYIGFTSDFMRDHLIEDFHVRKSRLFSIKVGLELNHTKKIKQIKVPPSINLNKKFILSYGRCHPTKGFLNLIKAYLAINDEISHNLILLMPIDHNQSEYYSEIMALTKNNNRIFSLSNFVSGLPSVLINHKNCSLVVSLSDREPCGLLPMEVRFYEHPEGPLLLVSNNGGLSEQVIDNENGFKVDPFNIEKITSKIYQILNVKSIDRKRIIKKGAMLLIEKYDMSKNLKDVFAFIKRKKYFYDNI